MQHLASIVLISFMRCLCQVSAAAFSPRVNSNIAVALVSSSVVFAEEVVVVCDDGKRRAEVIELPFV